MDVSSAFDSVEVGAIGRLLMHRRCFRVLRSVGDNLHLNFPLHVSLVQCPIKLGRCM